jgi:hypothetical protein
MLQFRKHYYKKTIIRNRPPVEVFDEEMFSDDVCIKYLMKTRELDDEFEYIGEIGKFRFFGEWEGTTYVVINNISEALRNWPQDGMIYVSARVTIKHRISEIIFQISNWNSWKLSDLSSKISNWR